MTTFPYSVLVDPLKIEELFQKFENRKKLEQMLMDPRVIELSRQSPQSRQALAAVVRRLQEERERKRRIRNVEQKEDEPGVKWFNCINFLKTFSAPPRINSRQVTRPPENTLRQKNKVSRSSPNLESTALPDFTNQEPTAMFMTSQAMVKNPMAEMAVCLPNMNKDGTLPMNVMDFCTSERGMAMITSLINSTDLTRLFGMKSILPTESHQLSQCIDCWNSSGLRRVECYIPRMSSSQSFIILRSRATWHSFPALTFDGAGLKSVVSSSTQTAYSVSCSRCSSHCLSTDSFSSYNEPIFEANVRKNPLQLELSKRNTIVKGSKSQSAMYTTDYSECDCDNCSSPDEICGAKYISRILTKAEVPDRNYLTTPDVLVTYSGKEHSSDCDSSSSSCKACKGNISSESFQREPREIWTQKRLKTSCESCLNTFRTEYIRRSRYSRDMAQSSNRSESFGSLFSDEFSQETVEDVRGNGDGFYTEGKSILDTGEGENEQKNEIERQNDMVLKDICIYEERMVREENYDFEMRNNNSLGFDGDGILPIEFDSQQTDSNDKQTESVYESTAQSPNPMVEKSLSYSSVEKEDDLTSEYPKNQLDGGPPPTDSSGLQPPVPDRDMFLVNDLLSTSTSGEDSEHPGGIVARMRKQRKRARNKLSSTSGFSDSSTSSSSMPQFRTFPRRLKTKPSPIQTPTIQQQNLLQKITKQKSRKKNCAIM